ncbi:hypothetical protein CRUP_026618, partial [Coryphaenoides rupestris]
QSEQQELFPLGNSCAVCGKVKCQRHRPTLLLENYQPWLDLKVHSKVDASVAEVFELVLENFVYPWYRDITDDEACVDELRLTFRFFASVVVRRAMKVDVPVMLAGKVMKAAAKHMEILARVRQRGTPADTHPYLGQPYLYLCLGQTHLYLGHWSDSPVPGSDSPVPGSDSPVPGSLVRLTCTWVRLTCTWIRLTCTWVTGQTHLYLGQTHLYLGHWVRLTCTWVSLTCTWVRFTCTWVRLTCTWIRLTCTWISLTCTWGRLACTWVRLTCTWVSSSPG